MILKLKTILYHICIHKKKHNSDGNMSARIITSWINKLMDASVPMAFHFKHK